MQSTPRLLSPIAAVSRLGLPMSMSGRHADPSRYSRSVVTALFWALGAGAEQVVLFADLDNPTSNRVYRRLGFMPVGDSVVVGFRVP